MTEPIEFAVVSTTFEDLYLREYPGLIAVAFALSCREYGARPPARRDRGSHHTHLNQL